jgi:hypothetical protein
MLSLSSVLATDAVSGVVPVVAVCPLLRLSCLPSPTVVPAIFYFIDNSQYPPVVPTYAVVSPSLCLARLCQLSCPLTLSIVPTVVVWRACDAFCRARWRRFSCPLFFICRRLVLCPRSPSVVHMVPVCRASCCCLSCTQSLSVFPDVAVCRARCRR